jgi:hypothetical protein
VRGNKIRYSSFPLTPHFLGEMRSAYPWSPTAPVKFKGGGA